MENYIDCLKEVAESANYIDLETQLRDCAIDCADDDRLYVHVKAIADIMGRLRGVLDSMADMNSVAEPIPTPPAPEGE